MNLKLKRLVRTTSSEQYALFDLDQTDEEDDLPLTIGKLDLHYTAEGVYGTMLLWDDASRNLRPANRRAFVQALLEDIVQPMGVPNEYVVEFFAPTLDYYEVFHNVDIDEDAEDEPDDEVGEADFSAHRTQQARPQAAQRPAADDESGEYPDGDLDDDELDDDDLDDDETTPAPRRR